LKRKKHSNSVGLPVFSRWVNKEGAPGLFLYFY
jgi:hypothetical protein